MAKHPQGMDHRQKLEDMSGVCLLGCREFPALEGDRMLLPCVIRLREHRRNCVLAGIRREGRATARVEGA